MILLAADALRSRQHVTQKINFYLIATEYFLGQKIMPLQELNNNSDVYTILLNISSHLCKFLLKNFDEKVDPLRVAAIRGIEFLIEYLGCTISLYLPQILKTIILTYP